MVDSFTGQPMDEVLASIRRIIAEDKPAGQAAPLPPTPLSQEEDVLELGPERQAPPPVSPQPASQPSAAPHPALGDALLSDVSASASRQALAALSGVSIDPGAPANSLDGLVREMLRPMLKAWLDANLPELVERMVAREIARIGGR